MTANILGDAAALFELVPDGIIAVRADGQITHASARAEALLGYERGELVGSSIHILVPAHLRESHRKSQEEYFAAPVPRLMGSGKQLVAIRKDGSELAVDVSLAPMSSASGQLTVAGIRDRTEALKITGELRRSRSLLHSLLLSVPDTAIFSIDNSGIIRDWNIGATQVTGFAAHDAIGESFLTLFPKAARDAGEPEQLLATAAKTDIGLRHGWLIRADASRFYATASMSAIPDNEGQGSDVFAVVVRDRTESMLAAARQVSVVTFEDVAMDGFGLTPLFRRLVELVHDTLSPLSTVFTVFGDEESPLTQGQGIASQLGTPIPDPRLPSRSGANLEIKIDSQHESFGTLQVTHDSETRAFTTLELNFARDMAGALVSEIARRRIQQTQERLLVIEHQERIARDLHDGVIQGIFGAGLQLQTIMAQTREQSTSAEVAKVIDDLDGCIRSLRSAIFGLESNSEERGIRQKASDLGAQLAPVLGFIPIVQFEGPREVVLASMVAQDTLLTLRELLSNVAKHASATRVEVSLEVGESLTLTVSDDGVGIPVGVEFSGKGLRNLANRAQAHGGEFSWRAGESGGTVSVWRVRELSGTVGSDF